MPPVVTPPLQSSASTAARAFNSTTKKQKSNFMLTMTLVLIVALVAIGVARTFSAPKEAATIQVVCATKDLPAGCRISFGLLHLIEVPKQYFHKGMYQSYNDVVGKYTRTFIPVREPLNAAALILDPQGLTAQLPRGQRGVTLKLSEEATVDAQVRPGDRVDVVATTPYKGKKFTKTICQNLLVLLSSPKETMLSDSLRSQDQSKVTLAVNPAEAEVLSQAVEESKLRLTLRSLGDLSRAELQGSDERDLLPHDALRQEPPAAQLADSQPQLVPPAPPIAATATESAAFAGLPQILPPEPLKWVVDMFSGSTKQKQEIEVRH